MANSKPISASRRYTIQFPVQDEESYAFFNRHLSTVWTNTEMDYSRDKHDYASASPAIQRVVNLILAFFSAADGIVVNNISQRFMREAQTFEQQLFYHVQNFMEVIHATGYSMAVNSLISDPDKREEIFKSADELGFVSSKSRWMEEYMESDLDQIYRVVGFACAEGIFFISAFLVIFWLRSKNLMRNFIFLNEQISKDETLHRDFACHLFRRLKNSQTDRDLVERIVKQAVEVEKEFIDELLVEEIDDLTRDGSKAYVESLANHLLISFGYEAIYEETKLPSWMNDIAMQQKSNLYEVGGGNYRMGNLEKEESSETSYSNPEDVDF